MISLITVVWFLKFFQFSKLYELSDEPERKEFLNKYQAFMNSQGNEYVVTISINVLLKTLGKLDY